MSGGHFDYVQHRLNNVADDIERLLEKQGKEKDKNELYSSREYYLEYPDEKYHYTYPQEVQDKMREAIKQIRIAEIYIQRVDYLVSGDDGEESFLERLEEDLSEISR
jgi:hypothetical protein